ncbi:glutaredoxin-like protein C5orf63 homolog isoform X1 [Pteropus medius]|uniref:glutaredoxin-like protein C5orf63 homolog isoform X1 n=1 Tax=Pteropus vampyrus TaxID=132908 RepID=UPI00196B2714|nr:glutaredoxin-like protein C5orf63 homolog isoform X1 [Pteropus giganteus]
MLQGAISWDLRSKDTKPKGDEPGRKCGARSPSRAGSSGSAGRRAEGDVVPGAGRRRRRKAQDPCPLCDEAKEILEPYKNRFILQEVDITLPENSAWYERYKFDIPVFHLNGQFLMMHRVNISKLEKQLQKLEQQDARG